VSLVVGASTLDAVDFTAAGLLNAVGFRLGDDVTAFVDSSNSGERSGVAADFDPRLAAPLPILQTSPDGLTRQRMLPITNEAAVPWDLSCGRMDTLLQDAQRASIANGHPTYVTFLKLCYRALGVPGIIVRSRPSRRLNGDQAKRFLKLILAQVPIIDVEFHRFANGGSIVTASGTTFDHFQKVKEELYLVSGDGRRRQSAESLMRDGMLARGPLDMLALKVEGWGTLGHRPWYIDSEKVTDCSDSHAVCGLEVVRPLFVRYLRNRAREFSGKFSGVLLDDYSFDPGVSTYLSQLVRFHPWIPSTVRWLAESAGESRERWAWSQSRARAIVDYVKHGKVPMPPISPLSALVEWANELDASARLSHAVDENANGREYGIAQGMFRRMDTEIDLVRVLHSDLGIMDDFGHWEDASLDYISARVKKVEQRGLGRDAVDELRAMVWRLVQCMVRSLMLFGDTRLRASVPLLAAISEGPCLAEAGLMFRREIQIRAKDSFRLVVV
jgi:hypothetical protein